MLSLCMKTGDVQKYIKKVRNYDCFQSISIRIAQTKT